MVTIFIFDQANHQFYSPAPRPLTFQNTPHLLWIEVPMLTDGNSQCYTYPVKEASYRRCHPNIEILEEWIPTVKKHNNNITVEKQTPDMREQLHSRNVRIEMHQSQTTSCLTGNQCAMCN